MVLYINPQSVQIRKQIDRRSQELLYVCLSYSVILWLIFPASDESVHKKKALNGRDVAPSNIPSSSHPITPQELDMIQNEPLRVVGKKFIAMEAPETYQIVGAGEMIEKGTYYQLRMEGCVDFIEMRFHELQELLQNCFVVD